MFYSVSPPQPENSSETTSLFSSCTHTVLFPLLHPKKRKNSWTLPTSSPPLCPESNQRERQRKKKERGGAGEGKCVLKMAGLPLAAQLHSHVCGRADVLREDGRAVVWKSKMAAKLHIIKLSCIPHQKVSKPLSNAPPLHVQTHFW